MSFIVKQKVKDKIYLYSVESYYDKTTKKVKQRRKYIGPQVEEKLADISQNLQNISVKNFGNIYFLSHLIKNSGIEQILKILFPDFYTQIINMVFYQICQADASYLFHYWFDDQYLTNSKKLFSDDISELFIRLGNAKSERIEFVKQWIELQKPVKTIYYDITSISSYSKNIDMVEWGYNRDKEELPQINMGMVYSQHNHVPLWYNVFAGSIVDVTTLRNTITYANYFKIKDIMFVMDCGFFSKSNIIAMGNSENPIKFIMPVSQTTKAAKTLITKHGRKISLPESAILYNQQVIHYQKTNLDYGLDNLDIHLFSNPNLKLDIENQLLAMIIDFENKHNDFKINTLKDFNKFKKTDIPNKLQNYFKWNKTNLNLEKDIRSIKKDINKSGCFMLATNVKELDKIEVLKYYRNKDIVEKVFDIVKNELDTNRLRTHKQESTEGELFVKFISAIVYSLIGAKMEQKNLYKTLSLRELLYEMQKIKITVLDEKTKSYSVLTKRQKKILEAFEIPTDFNMVNNCEL